MEKFFDEKIKQSLREMMFGYKQRRKKALGKTGADEDAYKKQVSEIRGKVFGEFEKKLEQAKQALAENGFVVHEAQNSQEAREIFRNILKSGDVVAKAKTNTAREIGIEEVLKDFDFFQTDLGDAIVQLFQEQDQHYVLPAIHLSAEKISAKIKQADGVQIEADPEKLTRYLCGKIRENILRANVGFTGANFFTTTGQIVLLENEGNISLVSRLPQKHIVLAGIDKLVETIEDATVLCRTAAIFGTGQDITQYISVISGPSKTADIANRLVLGAQGARQVHVILLDNGRRQMLKQGFGDLLKCINCGACINFCPVYHQLGNGYGGDKYLGSKGIITEALAGELTLSKEKGSFKCTLCGSCAKNCPMEIPLSEMVRKVRILQNKNNLQTDANKKMLEKVEKFGNPFGERKGSADADELYCC